MSLPPVADHTITELIGSFVKTSLHAVACAPAACTSLLARQYNLGPMHTRRASEVRLGRKGAACLVDLAIRSGQFKERRRSLAASWSGGLS
jgi:hypothetical protein